MQQITVNLEDNLLAFIDRYAEGVGLDRPEVYRISYVQKLLSEYRTAKLNQEIRLALEADRDDPEYQAELALWDCVVGDGIDAEVSAKPKKPQMITLGMFKGNHSTSEEDFKIAEFSGDDDDRLDWACYQKR